MNNLFEKFKRLTKFKYTDMARFYNVSKQYINQNMSSEAITQILSNKYMLLEMTDLKIVELESKINELKRFKEEIKEY